MKVDEKYDQYDQPDLTWGQNPINEMLDPQLEYSYSDTDSESLLTNKQVLPSNIARDPRNRNTENLTEYELEMQKSRKKNLSDDIQAMNPNDFKNIYAARNRLLTDLNELPSEILRQTFEHNKAFRQSRDSKFEEQTGKEVEKKEAKSVELPETLWDLESEKELEDRENGYYRGKRDTNDKIRGISKVTSTGKFMV